MKRLAGIFSVALVAASLAACGGSSTRGANSPAAAVMSYITGLANGDGGAVCNVITAGLQSHALRTAHSQGVKASSCASLFSKVKAHISAAQRRQLLNAKIAKVTQTGNTASVSIRGASNPAIVSKSGGRWLISGGIGF